MPARRARAERRDLPNWATTRKALEEALGMTFSGEKGEHFFRSTLVQTFFYGLFAAWVFWAEHHPPADARARFRWREAAGYLHIPILQKLFYDFSQPGPLGMVHIDEVLDWAAEALDRTDRASFFSTFEQSHAVQCFHEPFLEAFHQSVAGARRPWERSILCTALPARTAAGASRRGHGPRERSGEGTGLHGREGVDSSRRVFESARLG